MKTLKEFIETMTVGIVLLGVLLPIRLLFVRYIADDWLGSFGLVTAFSILIIVLAKKNKLGWFGRAFSRQMFKIHHGRRKYFVYSQLLIGVLFFAGSIYAIELGDSLYQVEKQMVLDELDVDSFDEFLEKSDNEIRYRDIPMALLVVFYIILFRFDIFAIMIASLNEMTDGWVLHFSTVFLVEEVELIGIAILTKFTMKKPET